MVLTKQQYNKLKKDFINPLTGKKLNPLAKNGVFQKLIQEYEGVNNTPTNTQIKFLPKPKNISKRKFMILRNLI
jgi:hypothetical protein